MSPFVTLFLSLKSVISSIRSFLLLRIQRLIVRTFSFLNDPAADMASVIYLDSSDDEHEPVPKRVEQQIPSHVKQLDSVKPSAAQGKVERIHGDPSAQRKSVEHLSVPSARSNATVSNDQAREPTGTQPESREKWTPVPKRTSAADVVGPSSAEENSLSRHFWQAGDYESQVVMKKRPLAGIFVFHSLFLSAFVCFNSSCLAVICKLIQKQATIILLCQRFCEYNLLVQRFMMYSI